MGRRYEELLKCELADAGLLDTVYERIPGLAEKRIARPRIRPNHRASSART